MSFLGLLNFARKISDASRAWLSSKNSMMAEIKTLSETVKTKEEEIALLKTRITYYEGSPDYYLNKKTIHPGIIFNAIHKSAGVFITRTLAESLDIEFREIAMAHGFFPNYFVMPNALERLKRGNVIRHEHFDANPVNIEAISRFTDRLVVHIRDPRQGTLSWMHHAEKLHAEYPEGFNYSKHFAFPDGYETWSFEKRLDWQIETELVSLVEWTSGWAQYVDRGGKVKILLTQYEEFLKDERSFMMRILDFYGISEKDFNFSPPEKTIEFNFRKGSADEWVDVYTNAQKARSAEIIGSKLLSRFDWIK